MEAKELRVGNWFNCFGSNHQVSWSTIKDLENAPKSQIWCKPIIITEEWLVRLGFEKKMAWTFSKELSGNKILVYYLGEKGFSIGFKNYSDFDCKYVHQLQNLYFSLTGKELQWNELQSV